MLLVSLLGSILCLGVFVWILFNGGFVIFFILSLIGSLWLPAISVEALLFLIFPSLNPNFKRLLQDSGFEKVLKNTERHKSYFHETFFFRENLVKFTFFKYSEIDLVYPKQTDHYLYFFKTSSNHALVFHLNDGSKIEESLFNQEEVKRALEYINRKCPHIQLGYHKILVQRWKESHPIIDFYPRALEVFTKVYLVISIIVGVLILITFS